MNFDSTIEYQRRTMNAQMGGVVIPLFTPLNKREEIERESMVKLIDYVIKGGVHGIFVMGTTMGIIKSVTTQPSISLDRCTFHFSPFFY